MFIVVAVISTLGVNTVSAAPGDTIFVNDTGGNDAWDGLSPHYNIATGHGPKKSIKNGIAAVNTNGLVSIANGTYKGNDNIAITITRNMKIIGESQAHTIINGSNTAYIFQISSDVNVVIKNLTFTNGKYIGGGAIHNDGALDATSCTFINNYSAGFGGAIDNEGETTSTINKCTFIGNRALSNGGAIMSNGLSILILNQSTFINNTGRHGGAVSVFNRFTTHFNAFIGNSAMLGSDISFVMGEGSFNVEDNWWGSNNGPAPGSIIGGNYPIHWVIFGVTGNPNTINYGETSTVVADFNHVNGGGDLIGGNIPDDIPVEFNTAWGTITDSSYSTKDGTVQAVYHANGPILTTPVRIYANTENEKNTVYTTINIKQAPTKLNVKPVSGYKGDDVDLTATLTYNNNLPLSGKTVRFTVNNKFVGNAVTNALGIATLPYRIVENIGTYDIRAEFIQDDNYLASSGINSLSVLPTPTTIKTESLTGNKGDTVKLTATLLDKIHDLPLAGKTVEFLINNKLVGSAVTDSNGNATLPYKILQNGGNYHIDALFAGDSIYKSSTGGASLKVNQSDVYVNVKTSNNNPKIGERIFITFKVGNRGPDTANNVLFTFKVPQGMDLIGVIIYTGSYDYNDETRTITWNIGDVPVGDPELVMGLKVLKEGNFTIKPGLSTSTYDPNLTRNIGNIIVNVSNSTNPQNNTDPSKPVVQGQTVPMQPTGAPVIPLLLGMLLTAAGIITTRKN